MIILSPVIQREIKVRRVSGSGSKKFCHMFIFGKVIGYFLPVVAIICGKPYTTIVGTCNKKTGFIPFRNCSYCLVIDQVGVNSFCCLTVIGEIRAYSFPGFAAICCFIQMLQTM